MKTLLTLIKLHKKQLDDLLNQITQAEKQRDELIANLESLTIQAAAELKQFYASEYAYMLESYLKKVEASKKQLTSQIKDLNEKNLELREELANQFAELKKFEIALQNRKNIEQDKEKKNEIKLLDEFSINKVNSGQ